MDAALRFPTRDINRGNQKALRSCSPQRVRSAQHTPTGRERAFLRRKVVLGDISLHKLCGLFVL
nr:MAG TPA: hypothetical protein [Caudoviricetes sp.]